MGRYFTCGYCGVEAKGSYDCDCHAKIDKEISEKMVGNKILSCEIVHDIYCSYLVQTLEMPDGTTFVLRIDLSSEVGSSLCIMDDSVIHRNLDNNEVDQERLPEYYIPEEDSDDGSIISINIEASK